MSEKPGILLRAGLYAFSAVALLFLVLPILAALPLSFNSVPFFSFPMPGFSLRWYEQFLGSDAWRRAIGNSMTIAGFTTAIVTPLGVIAALGVSRASPRVRSVVTAILLAPLVTPVVITAVAMYFLFSSLGMVGTLPGIVIAHSMLATPFVITIVSAGLAHFDSNMLRAAASLGASPSRAFVTVLLPQILPSVVSAAIFAFITSFDEVVVVFFLARVEQYTMTVELWKGIREDVTPTVLAVACFMVVLQVAAMAIVELIRAWSRRARPSVGTGA
jgi:putative spermidine/putrescine transport system permease protein